MIRVEFFEMARRLAGASAVEVEATTLREALAAVATAYPALVPDVIRGDVLAPHWRAGLDGRNWLSDPDHPLHDGNTLQLISALAGG